MRALFTLAVIIGLAGQPAQAVQTCPAGNPRVAPDSRYTEHGDGTVTDLRTGLMWKQCSEGQTGAACTGAVSTMTWANALNAAENTVLAGFGDWRLPNAKELGSLVETGCHDPTINAARFPNILTAVYWTSSSHVDNASLAWGVNFFRGDVYYFFKSNSMGVRLVRGGQ